MKTFITATVIVIITLVNIFAQEADKCATIIPEGTTLAQSKSNNLSLYRRTTLTDSLRLAIHVVRNSLGQGGIEPEILDTKWRQLNYFMSQANFCFKITSIDMIDSDVFFSIDNENEIIQLLQVNNKHAFINIYFVPNFPGYNGVATFSPRINNTGLHGIIVTNNAPNSTLPHEMGHFFDLFHTYETYFGNENINRTGSCSNWWSKGDLLEDTPADPSGRVIFSTINNNCQWDPLKPLPADSCGQTNYSPLTTNMMITEVKWCQINFTQDQKDRMNETLLLYRSELTRPFVYLENRANNQNAGDSLMVNQTKYPSGSYIPLNPGTYYFTTNKERFPYLFNTGFSFKHHNWNNMAAKLFLSQSDIITDDKSEIANFTPIKYSKIEAKLENISITEKGAFEFQDPWYVKSDLTQPGNYWIPCLSSYEPNGKFGAPEKGVFLNQGYNPINQTWTPPYYSVKADAIQDIQLPQTGRTHRFYFQNWSANPPNSAEFQNANALETGVVFKQAGATVQANLKGTQLSNNPNAYANNSQQKIISPLTI